MTTDFTVNRPLAGGTKNLLDDLLTLDAKIPQEIERGVRESYLESSKVKGLAEKLKVKPPRIRTRRWVYVEYRQIHSVQIDSYDDEDAIGQFNEAYGSAVRNGEVPYGLRRSYWANMPSGAQRNTILSEPTTTRPELTHDLRFYVQRDGDPVSLVPSAPEPDSVPVPDSGPVLPQRVRMERRSPVFDIDPLP